MWFKPLFCLYMALPILLAIGLIIWTMIRQRRTTRWPISQKLLRPPGESLRKKLEEFDQGVLLQFCLGNVITASHPCQQNKLTQNKLNEVEHPVKVRAGEVGTSS